MLTTYVMKMVRLFACLDGQMNQTSAILQFVIFMVLLVIMEIVQHPMFAPVKLVGLDQHVQIALLFLVANMDTAKNP